MHDDRLLLLFLFPAATVNATHSTFVSLSAKVFKESLAYTTFVAQWCRVVKIESTRPVNYATEETNHNAQQTLHSPFFVHDTGRERKASSNFFKVLLRNESIFIMVIVLKHRL